MSCKDHFQVLSRSAIQNDVFYLQPLGQVPSNPSEVWFKMTPVGKNTLGTMVKRMCDGAEALHQYEHTSQSQLVDVSYVICLMVLRFRVVVFCQLLVKQQRNHLNVSIVYLWCLLQMMMVSHFVKQLHLFRLLYCILCESNAVH